MKDEGAIIGNDPIKTVFNGKTYLWYEKPRREQRNVRAELLNIASLLPGITDGNIESLRLSIDVVNLIHDFCEDNNTEWDKDGDDIEDYIKADGAKCVPELINQVYVPLFNAWLKPWLDTPKKKPAVKAKAKKR